MCGVHCTFLSVPANGAGHDVVALSDLLKDTEHPTCSSSVPSKLNNLQTNKPQEHTSLEAHGMGSVIKYSYPPSTHGAHKSNSISADTYDMYFMYAALVQCMHVE